MVTYKYRLTYGCQDGTGYPSVVYNTAPRAAPSGGIVNNFGRTAAARAIR